MSDQPELPQKEAERESEGIQAIIYLKSMAGVKESEASARIGWRALSRHAQNFTLRTYREMKAKEN